MNSRANYKLYMPVEAKNTSGKGMDLKRNETNFAGDATFKSAVNTSDLKRVHIMIYSSLYHRSDIDCCAIR